MWIFAMNGLNGSYLGRLYTIVPYDPGYVVFEPFDVIGDWEDNGGTATVVPGIDVQLSLTTTGSWVYLQKEIAELTQDMDFRIRGSITFSSSSGDGDQVFGMRLKESTTKIDLFGLRLQKSGANYEATIYVADNGGVEYESGIININPDQCYQYELLWDAENKIFTLNVQLSTAIQTITLTLGADVKIDGNVFGIHNFAPAGSVINSRVKNFTLALGKPRDTMPDVNITITVG
jgi:predicted small secreted protein